MQVGAGSHGSVYEHTDPACVVKRMPIYRTESNKYGSYEYLGSEAFTESVALLRAKACNVPHIVHMHQLDVDVAQNSVDIRLEKLIRLNMAYSDQEVRKYVRQLFEAVAGLHKAGIYHCDIKIENLMLTPDTDDLKIIDFGLARVDADQCIRNEPQGLYTKPYRAPEIMMLQHTVDLCKTDVWAAGVCAAELMMNRDCIFGTTGTHEEFLSAIMTGVGCGGDSQLVRMPFWPQFLSTWDPEKWRGHSTLPEMIDMRRGGQAADFIISVLKVGPGNRPSAQEMLSHPYLSGASDTSLIPEIYYLSKPLNYTVLDTVFKYYSYKMLGIAMAMLEFLNLPLSRPEWISAATEIVCIYLGGQADYADDHFPDRSYIMNILKTPHALEFLARRHVIL